MAKTLAQIRKQISQLQKEADTLKEREMGGVVARIKEAIDRYALTPQDLFGARPRRPGARPGRRATVRRVPSPPKFRDEAGNAWSGHGKRPNWFKAALESGKTPDDLLIK